METLGTPVSLITHDEPTEKDYHQVVASVIIGPFPTEDEAKELEVKHVDGGIVWNQDKALTMNTDIPIGEDLTNIKRDFQVVNVDFINIQTDRSYIVPLINFFKMREKRK